MPNEVSCGRLVLGVVGSAQLIDSHHELWPLVMSS
jgi:hypothetical protein